MRRAATDYAWTPAGAASSHLVREWRELADRAAVPNPYFEPSFLVPQWEELGDSTDSGLLTVRRDGQLVGVLPLSSMPSGSRLPLPGRQSGLGEYGFFGCPLVSAGDEPTAAGAIARWLGQQRRAQWVRLDMLPADEPVARHLLQALGEARLTARVRSRVERAVLRRDGDARLQASVGDSARARLARKRRALGREVGADVSTVDRSGDPAAVADFLQVEASGWKGREGSAFASRPGHAAFLSRLCAGFRAEGKLQILALQAGDRALAVRCTLVTGQVVYAFKTAYDESLSRFSPGMLLELDMIETHDRAGVGMIDACGDPDNAWLNGVYPDRRPLLTVLIGCSTLGRAAVAAMPVYSKVRTRLHDLRAARSGARVPNGTSTAS